MSVHDELVALEREAIRHMVAGTAADFYRDILTDDALLVVPGAILDGPTFLEGLEGEPEMRTLELHDPRVIELGQDGAVLLYRAVATLPGGGTWTSMMNTTYVRRDGRWRVAYHQQTP